MTAFEARWLRYVLMKYGFRCPPDAVIRGNLDSIIATADDDARVRGEREHTP